MSPKITAILRAIRGGFKLLCLIIALPLAALVFLCRWLIHRAVLRCEMARSGMDAETINFVLK